MTKGRRPKPTRLKLIAGNPGKRPLNKNEPQPEPRAPKCPSHLTGKARAEWRRMARQLYDLGLLTDIDRAALAGYCLAYGRWIDAEEALTKHGIVVRAPSGFPMPSPFLAIANKALEQVHRFGIEFGMTPASRSRVSAIPPHRSGNPFIGAGQHECGADAASGADRAEQIGVLVALVGRQGRARASLGPDPGAAVLLAQPGFILEPDLDRPPLGQVAYVGIERAREVFLNASRTGVSWPGCFGRPLM